MIGPFSFTEINALESFTLQKPTFVKTHDGINLAYYTFLPKNPKAVVIFYHGGGLYTNKTYQWVGKELQNKFNIASYMVDIRGHGYSEGERGDSPSINAVFRDVDSIVSVAKFNFPNKPLFLCGHSSGAGLIINYAAHTQHTSENGYIFLAPYLGPKSDTAKEHKNSEVSFIKSIRPWVYILGAIFPNSFITHCKAVFFNYPKEILKSDPLILPWYTYVMSCATTPYEIEVLLKKIEKPVGLYIGEHDEQFIPEKVISYKSLINAPVKEKIIENVGHLSILLKAPEIIANYINEA